MAKYAQGYERKNTDTKNLIILFSTIVGIVVLAIVGVVIYNAVKKEDTLLTYDSVKEEYVIDVANMDSLFYKSSITQDQLDSKLLTKVNAPYLIFFYCDSDSQDTIKVVLDYYDVLEKDSSLLPLYLIEGESITTNVKEALDNYQASEGDLIKIENKDVVESFKYSGDSAVEKLKELMK